MPNPFDWKSLTTAPSSGDILQPFAVLYAIVFIAGFVVSTYLYYRPWTRPIGRLYRRKSVIRAMGAAMWVFGIGVFFFLIRLLQIDPLTFGRPFWMWLSVIAVVVLAVAIGIGSKGARKATDERLASKYGARRRGNVQVSAPRPVRRRNSTR